MNNTDNLSSLQPYPILKFSMTSEKDKLLVPLFLLGKFYHPSYGEVEYTQKDYLDIKRNLKENSLGFKPYITHGHIKSSRDSDKYVKQAKLEALSTDAELKRGEFVDVVLQDNVVYGLATNLHPDTKEFIESKQYEFASGEFMKNFTDKETGKNLGTVMFRTALTNAPFMPFKDKKLQLFSTKAESPLNDCTFVVKLQEDNELTNTVMPENEANVVEKNSTAAAVAGEAAVAIEETLVAEQEVKEESVDESSETPAVKEKAFSESEKVEEVTVAETEIKPEQEEKPEVEELSTAAPTEKVEDKTLESTPPTNDMTKELDSIRSEFASQLEAMKEAYETNVAALKESATTQISSLNQTIESLNQKLTEQESLAHQFSTAMAEKAKKERYERMASRGVTPALIEKYSLLESALSGASISNKVLKFSTSEGETQEANLLDSLEDLLVEASLTKSNVSVHRFGQSEFESNDLISDLKRIANR